VCVLLNTSKDDSWVYCDGKVFDRKITYIFLVDFAGVPTRPVTR